MRVTGGTGENDFLFSSNFVIYFTHMAKGNETIRETGKNNLIVLHFSSLIFLCTPMTTGNKSMKETRGDYFSSYLFLSFLFPSMTRGNICRRAAGRIVHFFELLKVCRGLSMIVIFAPLTVGNECKELNGVFVSSSSFVDCLLGLFLG